MQKTIPGFGLLFAPLFVLAQEAKEVPVPSAVDADPTALIVCAVLFLGMIGVFFGYVWVRERKNRNAGK